MFITTKRAGYDRSGQQVASGLFLMLFDTGRERQLGACVRFVSMAQCGHWMMGRARFGRYSMVVSGSYGNDGLACDLEINASVNGQWKPIAQILPDTLVPLPADLYEKWNTGGGWNSAGSEAEAMRKWAIDNLAALRVAGKVNPVK